MASRGQKPKKLEEVLRSFPESDLARLMDRLGIRVDPAKRLDAAAQAARALVALPDLRDTGRLPAASVELLHRVAEAKGTLLVASIPPALEPLVARGLMFARQENGAYELLVPAAYLLQLRSWEGEDPRGIRALLAQASFETTSAIASHYLGRTAAPPLALALETAWDVLSDPRALAAEIERLAPSELRVLETVEQEGGEVDTEELLEIEREPLRLRTASGVSPSRRGVGSALERRGFLVPVHPNRHIVPTEVSLIVSASRRAERAARRDEVKRFVRGGDHAPRRARFALDPGPITVGLAMASRESGDVRANVGTPKSLAQKMAVRFGRDGSHVAMLVALGRAIGLWDPSALSAASPPGALTIGELTSLLFAAWRRGGAWDEARTEPEVLRIAEGARDPSPIAVVRELVLEALVDLGEGWIPWVALERYFRSDHRMAGLTRLFRRWAERAQLEVVSPIAVARRIVLESLPGLGMLDLGEDDSIEDLPVDGDADPSSRAEDRHVVLRLTPRGRSLLSVRSTSRDESRAKFIDSHVLRIAATSRVAAVLALAPLVEVARAAETLDLLVAPQTLARALSAGVEADLVRQRLEAVSALPEGISKTLAQASIVLGRASFTASGGFLWVDDPNLRELLRTRKATSELFLDPSPPAGLLVAAGVDLERLSRRCRSVGIEVIVDGQVVRARTLPPPSITPPPPRASSTQRKPGTPSSPPMVAPRRRAATEVRIEPKDRRREED
jgi:hypothetical protein